MTRRRPRGGRGGQCKPPFLLPLRNRRYTTSLFEDGGVRRLYINRGIDYLIRVRFEARVAIAVFTLRPAEVGSGESDPCF